MSVLARKQTSKPEAFTSAIKRRKPKRAKFKDKDLVCLANLEGIFTLGPYESHHHNNCGNVYIERSSEDGDVNNHTDSISSFSTNATMDNNIGTGRALDMYFYQPLGRAIERLALSIGTRLNIVHPSPIQILRFIIELDPRKAIWSGKVRKLGDVMDVVYAASPTLLRGVLSLVEQSQ